MRIMTKHQETRYKYQGTITKKDPMNNNQRSKKFGHWPLVIGHCLVFVSWCLVFVSWLLVFVQGAWACSCIRGTPDQYFNDADTVFIGKALDVERNLENEFEVKFEVFERRKMSGSDKTVIVRTALTAADCGYDFEPGLTYVVYAFEDGSRFYTDLCS